MLKFVPPGDPTPTDAIDTFVMTTNIFDVVSLMEGLEFAIIHYTHLIENEFAGTEYARSFDAKRRDAKANLAELKRVHDQRNTLVHGRP